MKIAIIDLGSNSSRMTIWQTEGNKVESIYNKRLYVRLSEGLAEDNLLKEEPKKRTLSALAEFGRDIAAVGCDKVVAVATEALRRAENSADFINTVKSETGIEITILSGDDEARYDLLASEEFINGGSAFLMDVGGGSVEIIRVDEGVFKDRISLPLGSVVMSDRFGFDNDALNDFFEKELSLLPMMKNAKDHFLIGLGGSIRSLFAFGNKLFDGAELKSDDFSSLYEKITTAPKEELKLHPAFSDRYDIINAGLAPYNALLKMSGAKKIVLCNKGVREGILRECLASN